MLVKCDDIASHQHFLYIITAFAAAINDLFTVHWTPDNSTAMVSSSIRKLGRLIYSTSTLFVHLVRAHQNTGRPMRTCTVFQRGHTSLVLVFSISPTMSLLLSASIELRHQLTEGKALPVESQHFSKNQYQHHANENP